MDCSKVQSLISEYSLGLVEGRKIAEIEAHLAVCPECKAELAQIQRVALLLDGLEQREPPAGLWNGVYNRITRPPERAGAWQRARNAFHSRATGWSVGFAAAAVAAIMLFSWVHEPRVESSYIAGEYVQGHAIYASQDFLADQAALNSIAAVAYREQVGGSHQ